MRTTDWLRLLLLSLVWGGSFFFGDLGLAALPPVTLACLRVGLAALALLAAGAALGRLGRPAAWPWGRLLVMGLLNNALPFSLILWGQTAIHGGLASILNATTPFWALLLAAWLLQGTALTPARLAGLALGFAGVLLLVGPEALAGLGGPLWHQLAVLAGAVCYALAGLWGRRLLGLSPWQAACGQLLCSSGLLLPLALLVERPWTLALPGAGTFAAVAGLALLSTALAYLLYFRILADVGPANLLLVTLMIPPSALLLGAVFLGQPLGRDECLGLLAILAGLAAIDGRAWRALAHLLRRPRYGDWYGGRGPS